jgi:hypothetical protein
MAALYLIGNGFDLHNDLKTSYADFHSYLIENNKELEKQIYQYFDLSENQNFLWMDFENNLSTFDTESFFETYDHIDVMSDSFKISEAYGLSDEIEQETTGLIDSITDAFTEWVQSIEIPEKKIPNIFTAGAAYITFNYTDTLEKLYGVQRQDILYIHGSATQYTELIFGHGENSESGDQDELDQDGNSNRTMLTDARNAAQYPLHALFKDTDAVLKRHTDFFNGLSDVEVIYVLGHSLGKADWPYFKRLAEIYPNATWIVSYYNEMEVGRLKATSLQITGVAENNLKMIKIDEM